VLLSFPLAALTILGRCDVPAASAVLEAQRGETQNEAKLDGVIAYLQGRAP
jgi:hypothetical protein